MSSTPPARACEAQRSRTLSARCPRSPGPVDELREEVFAAAVGPVDELRAEVFAAEGGPEGALREVGLAAPV